MPLSRVRTLTFDCYGTLIDWEKGILDTLKPVIEEYDPFLTDDEILTLYSSFEPDAEEGEFKPYREVLENVMQKFIEEFGMDPDKVDKSLLAESIRHWEPFPDTPTVLKELSGKYILCIISNIDNDLIRHSLEKIGVEFDLVVTAQEVGAYKPSVQNFRHALEKLGQPEEHILHVAQSKYHDIDPASRLGLKTVWVNRRKGKEGHGATPGALAQPDFEVTNLEELMQMLSKNSME